MKTNFLILFLICSTAIYPLFLGGGQGEVSAKNRTGESPGKTSGTNSLVAGCTDPTGFTQLEFNNVEARIHTGGDMFWDFATGTPRYEIPKIVDGDGPHSMFMASLWLGGTDVNGQLRIAAQQYRQSGVDYWTGPLDTITAEIDPTTCSEWDRQFVITRTEVDAHNAWYLAQEEFGGYVIPKSILEWPAHGDVSKGQDYFLAPYFDQNGDGFYDPYAGDYPYYDLSADVFCDRSRTRIPKLFGDYTIWWIFNDKGNLHRETGADAIGIEVHAQEFAFATNDEINNMTFTNYIIINRSTFSLIDTYFGTNFDPDIGYFDDDFVGCDVEKGLGYCYNGDPDDGPGGVPYLGNPPAIGVDFFEGPYMDARIDSPDVDRPTGGCDASINGLNFGDGEANNERWGMRRFIYYNKGNCQALCDPNTGIDYYNLLKGIWGDKTPMVYGGNGHSGGCTSCEPTNFMFPGDTDPCNWGLKNDPLSLTSNPGPDPVDNVPWTEESALNTPFDRRFVHSAGPFTLEPGAVNDITVGLVWAKAASGGPFESVEEVRRADEKAQALFDNCFKVLNGPDAPILAIQELNRELLLYISNPLSSNNYLERHEEIDPTIIPPDSIDTNNDGVKDYKLTPEDKKEWSTYRFQGYQIYQLKDATVSVSDLQDINLARLVAQTDIKDNVTQLVNYEFNDVIGANVPTLMVDGADMGIIHSFKVTKDLFTAGAELVNHKKYYFIALAYSYNNFKQCTQDLSQACQKKPYLGGRKDGFGRSIEAVLGIPHRPEVEEGGTEVNSKYGDSPLLTRHEGMGNGGFVVDLTQQTIDEILSGSPWKATNPVYQRAKAPVSVKIIDPLNVPGGNFAIYFEGVTDSSSWMLVDESDSSLAQNLHWQPNFIDFKDTSSAPSVVGARYIASDNNMYEWDGNKWIKTLPTMPIPGYAAWKDGNTELYVYDGTAWSLLEKAYHSDQTLKVRDEQIFPDMGISITVEQLVGSSPWRDGSPPTYGNRIYPGPRLSVIVALEPHLIIPVEPDPDNDQNPDPNNGFIEATMTFADNTKQWLTGIVDGDAPDALNWIRSGIADMDPAVGDYKGFDDDEIYENILGGLWAPYRMCSIDSFGLAFGPRYGYTTKYHEKNAIHNISGVDLVITSDKSKWTRSVVLEMEEDVLFAEGNAPKFSIRSHASVDKNGDPDGSGTGMGWFPGYAINVETGERLNIIFGEGSADINGTDMIWNPTSDLTSPLGQNGLDAGFGCVGGPSCFYPFWAGGKHYIYIVGYSHHETTAPNDGYVYGSIYDEGAYIRKMLDTINNVARWKVFKDIIWAGMPLLEKGYELINPGSSGSSETDVTILSDETDASYDVTIRLRVRRPYEKHAAGTAIFNPGPLEIGETYYVNKGPVVHNSITYNLGEVFVAVNNSFSIDPNSDSTDILPSTLPVSVIKTVNAANPFYKFSLDEFATRTGVNSIAENVLELINVVPNPYNAFSSYEISQIDHRIKIINLPEKCTVSIYNVSGTLIRRFERDDPTITSIDWDLKNSSNVPIAGGVYLIHVNAPGIGERVLKWFGALRPVDLDAF